jgi:DNA-binding MarR family transcriptional regulator
MKLEPVDALAQLSFLIQGTLERLAAQRELSIVQTRLLGILRDRTPTMRELTALLGLDKSSVSGLVDRAERRGLVQRVPSVVDRRSVTVALTEAGRSLVVEVAADFAVEVEALLEYLPAAERELLTELVGRLLLAHAAAHGVELLPVGD